VNEFKIAENMDCLELLMFCKSLY